MLNRRNIITLLAGTILAGTSAMPAFAQDRLQVVATFSILGDLVRQVGGDRIALTTLVGPDGDGHVYSPRPSDARTLAESGVVFTNGLLYEGWIDRLIEASGTEATIVTVADGINAIADAGHDDHDDHGHSHDDHEHDHDDHGHSHDDHGHSHDDHGHDDHGHDDHGHEHDDHAHGEFDPHAWQDVGNVKVYVANIRDALIAGDPDGADFYKANAEAYIAELAALDAEIRERVAALPEAALVITSHNAFRYFTSAYGLAFDAPVGTTTEAEATARGAARLIDTIRANNINSVFAESLTDARLIEQIAREADVPVAGTLYSDALSRPDGPAGTYIDMMRHNISLISEGLGS